MSWFLTDLSTDSSNSVVYNSNQANVNFFEDAGSPTEGDWTVYINPGVILFSWSIAVPSATTGVFPGKLTIVNMGVIEGRGGDGGIGLATTGKSAGHSGGGGGGAGAFWGVGGESGEGTGVPGAAGTFYAGGAGGTGGSNPAPAHSHANGGTGGDGGTALQLEMDITLNNSAGSIWGGGGGGGGGGTIPPQNGGAGGDPGEPGEDGTGATNIGPGGAGGKAVDPQGYTVDWQGGSVYPHIKGSVS